MPRITNKLSTSRVVIRNCSLDWYTNDLLSCEWQIRGLSYRSETGNLCCTILLVAEGFARASQLVNQPCRFQLLKKIIIILLSFHLYLMNKFNIRKLAFTIATMIHGGFFLMRSYSVLYIVIFSINCGRLYESSNSTSV